MNNFKKGDHLVARRLGYTHHGIYVGNGQVIHYLRSGVTLDSLETFADERDVHVQEYSDKFYSSEEIVKRAYSRLGDDCYNVVFNNCEHFACWCVSGVHRSSQVKRATVGVVGIGGGGYIAKKVIGQVGKEVAVRTGSTMVASQSATAIGSNLARSTLVNGAVKALVSGTAGTLAEGTTAALTSGATTVASLSLATVALPVVVAASVGCYLWSALWD